MKEKKTKAREAKRISFNRSYDLPVQSLSESTRMAISLLLIVSLLFFLLPSSVLSGGLSLVPISFSHGEKIQLECKLPKILQNHFASLAVAANTSFPIDSSGWSPGLFCSESQRPLEFQFSVDEFLFCGLSLPTEEILQYFNSLINQEESLQCRIPMSAERGLYIPLSFPIWGLIEPTHSHVNFHANFLFHYDEANSHIIGATIYPIRDRFQFIRPGSQLNFHGPVRWVSGQNVFSPQGIPDGAAGAMASGNSMEWYIICFFFSGVTGLSTAIFFILLYYFRVKPALVKKYLKGD